MRLAPQVQTVVPEGAVVKTWQDFNRALLFALRLEKGLMFVAVFLIVVVAAMSATALDAADEALPPGTRWQSPPEDILEVLLEGTVGSSRRPSRA